MTDIMLFFCCISHEDSLRVLRYIGYIEFCNCLSGPDLV